MSPPLGTSLKIKKKHIQLEDLEGERQEVKLDTIFSPR